MSPRNVLIAGAGPTGLVAAISLVKQGVAVRIIDKAHIPASTSRALVMHARTLELYQQLDLTEEILAAGHKLEAINLWSYGIHKARVPLDNLGSGLTRYPFVFVIPQEIHERVLEQKARSLGISVERQTQLLDFVDHGPHITARIQRVDHSEELYDAAYILACDGAHSAVRHAMEVDFQGGAYKKLFCLADIEGSGASINGEMHVHAMGDDFMLAVAYNDCSRVRVIGTVSEDESKDLVFDDMRPHIERNMGVSVSEVNWFTTYRVHHRVARKFRKGRAFLVGDAAHIHSPVGGQGMNTGIGDAINLAWKVAAVLDGKADDSLLDSYEIERRAFATRLVASTDRAFNVVTSKGYLANLIRQCMFSFVVPTAFRFQLIGDFFFRTVSQIQLNYQHSPLVTRVPESRIQAGDRLPFVKSEQGDNYSCITEVKWQIHVYGTTNSGLTEWCQAKHINLQQFEWNVEFQKVGFIRDAIYLLRPDSYIAAVIVDGDIDGLDQYLVQHHIEF